MAVGASGRSATVGMDVSRVGGFATSLCPGLRSLSASPWDLPCCARAGKADPRSAAPAHQQRQRLSRPPQAMAQSLQRRRHQEPAKLPRLAMRPRGLGPASRSAKMDPRRNRKRTIPTGNAIRAKARSPTDARVPPSPIAPRAETKARRRPGVRFQPAQARTPCPTTQRTQDIARDASSGDRSAARSARGS